MKEQCRRRIECVAKELSLTWIHRYAARLKDNILKEDSTREKSRKRGITQCKVIRIPADMEALTDRSIL